MIQVTRNWDGENYCLTIRGHAGDAPAGQSPVCGAASILYHVLHRLLKKNGAVFTIDEEKSGEARIYAQTTQQVFEKLEAAEEGFLLLAQYYPECVTLTKRDMWEMSMAPR